MFSIGDARFFDIIKQIVQSIAPSVSYDKKSVCNDKEKVQWITSRRLTWVPDWHACACS